MSDADMFVGLSDGVSAGADGVMRIPAGECGRVQTDGLNSIYLMGTGNALVVAQNYAECPFKLGGKGGEMPDLSVYAKKTDVPDIKVNEAVNADTLGGKSADDFTQIINFGGNQTDTKTAVGQAGKTTIYRCGNWTDYPSAAYDGQGTIISINYMGAGIAGTDGIWCMQTYISAHGAPIYMRFISSTNVSEWKEVYTAANKPYITGIFSGTAADIHLDYEPSFAIVNDDGNIKFGYSLISPGGGYDVKFENLSDTTHQYIIFK